MPNKKNKNSKYTGFYWYMQEIMPALKREGRVRGGIDQVVPIARPMWKALSKQDQDKYDKLAKEMKRKDSNNMFGLPQFRDDSQRLDNVGNIISQRTDQNEVNSEQRVRDRRFAKTKWPDVDEMLEFPFYFLAFEHLCELDVEKEFIPLEVSVVKWNMKSGILHSYHTFIDPGPIPVGYRYTCQHHSEETHQIPIEDFEYADSRYTEIWGALEDFVNPRGEAKDCPPLYCAFSDWRSAISMLEWLYVRSRVGRRNMLQKVFVLEDCAQDLADLVGISLSQGGATSMLQTSAYDYESNTRCQWHEEKEVRNCALGTVKRYAYAFADYFCAEELYNFEITAGAHLPTKDSSYQNHMTIHPDRLYMEPQGVSGVSKHNTTSTRGAMAAAENNGPFASRDIRYKQHEKVEINLDEDSEDDEDVESQYSYSTKLAASSYSDADRPKSSWISHIPLSDKPNITDVDEFPTLGGDGNKFASRSAAPPANRLPQPAFTDSGDSVQTGWQPSAAYLEKKREKEQHLSTLPSLEEKVSTLELNNNKSGQSKPVADSWSTANPQKPRQINSSTSSWGPKAADTKPVGRGAAIPVGRGRGMNLGSNPWAKGATRGDPEKAPPQIAVGGGRGRGSWVPKAEPEVGVRPSSPTGSMSSQAFRVRPPSPTGSTSSQTSSGSSIRPPPGFGRGIKPQMNNL